MREVFFGFYHLAFCRIFRHGICILIKCMSDYSWGSIGNIIGEDVLWVFDGNINFFDQGIDFWIIIFSPRKYKLFRMRGGIFWILSFGAQMNLSALHLHTDQVHERLQLE